MIAKRKEDREVRVYAGYGRFGSDKGLNLTMKTDRELLELCNACLAEIAKREEEGPFDTSRTMVDESGNTLIWDREREIYVNCGVQSGR